LSGAAGGNAAGKVLGNLNQGTLINSNAGVFGGGLGGTIRSAIGAIDLARTAGFWTSTRSFVRLLAVVLVVARCLPSLAFFATCSVNRLYAYGQVGRRIVVQPGHTDLPHTSHSVRQ
jgi:hypothetical protein